MLLKNASLLTPYPVAVEQADLRIAGGTIVERGKNLRPLRNEERVDLAGKYLMAGMVNAHTHLYSTLARGMSAPKRNPRSFVDILKQIWWKLDTALDDEAIYYSALVGSIEALKLGTTMLIDHHASPNHISGSLDLIKGAMSKTGIRGILCYETTGRGGKKRRDAGLLENERFIIENVNNDHFRGSAGAHASFTVDDDTLGCLGELAGMYDCGVHIHVAEDKADLDSGFSRGRDIVTRLRRAGALTHKSILAHGIHLSRKQLSEVGAAGAWMVHNPRSNMNNAVGHAPLQWFGGRSALGTDGFPSDMFEETRCGFLRNQECRNSVEFTRLGRMLHAGQDLASIFFGRPFGTLRKGASADLAVLDYSHPTPLSSRNLHAHLLSGLNSGCVQHVMVDGVWRVWNREIVGIDEESIMRKASAVARTLWHRMEKGR